MALYKEIRQDDGVMTTYHRILSFSKTINQNNMVVVLSYTDGTARGNEALSEYAPYRQCVTYCTEYDETMTAEKAYNFLKSLPVFEGAEDV